MYSVDLMYLYYGMGPKDVSLYLPHSWSLPQSPLRWFIAVLIMLLILSY